MIDQLLRQSLGKRLTRVVGDFHVFEGKVSAIPNSVWLNFEDVPQYHLRGASDGERLIADGEDPYGFDMQRYGAVRLQDMAAQQPFCKVLNQNLRRAWLIASQSPAVIIGVRLDFDTATVRVLNWGDDMYIAEGFPSDARPHEIAETPV